MKEKLYEITGIYDPDISEENLNAEIQKFQELVAKYNGKFAKSSVWGKIRLVYPIKKKLEGWFVTYYFKGEPSLPATLNNQLKLNERLLRFLIVRSTDKIPEETKEMSISTKPEENL